MLSASAAKTKMLGSAVLLFAGAATMLSSSDILSMTGFGTHQRRLQGATVPLRRLAATDYGNVGPGYCASYNDPSVIGSPNGIISPSAEDCSAQCDADPTCVAFEYDDEMASATEGGFYPCVLYDTYEPGKLEEYEFATCYVKISFLDSIGESYISVLGDPLFTGFQGQVLKFEGRDSAWYANLASPSLQWNLNFHKVSLLQFLRPLLRIIAQEECFYPGVFIFLANINVLTHVCHVSISHLHILLCLLLCIFQFDQCPAGEDMFVTSTSINLLKEDGSADSILVTVNGASPTQEDGLANGVLSIVVGEQTINTPGDYRFDDSGIRVVVHNTYGACSRKWYDYDKSIEAAATEHKIVEGAATSPSHRRLKAIEEPVVDLLEGNDEPSPLDLLLKSQGKMLDPEECDAWISERVTNGDLFDQRGGWATIYIMTPLVNYHLEVRQSDPETSPCTYQSLDTWISHITDELRAEEWRGIIGETRTSKEDENGNPIMYDRLAILDYPEDEAYEVDGPFGTSFVAKEAISTSVKLE